MTRLLAGDIGGTKTILRLEEFQAESGSRLVAEATYPSAAYPHLNPIIEEFLDAADKGPRPHRACLAIAGPVVNQTSQLTNLNWILHANQLAQSLEIPHVHLLNDFAAVGYGILALQPQDLCVLQEAAILPEQPIAVLGAGTGLGEALLVWQGKQYTVLAIEGGHTDFAPRNNLEVGLLQYLQKKFGRVSVERVVSGIGLQYLYEYLRDTGFAPESSTVQTMMATQTPAAVVSAQGLAQTDPLCEQALHMFVSAYGAEAGNLALKSLPYSGVYIAGGIGPKILAKMQDGTFIESFLDKGRLRPLLEKIQVSLILNPKVGLLGAALLAQRLEKVTT